MADETNTFEVKPGADTDPANLPADYAVPYNTPAPLDGAPDPARDFDPARLPNATPAYFNPSEGSIDKTVPEADQPKVDNVKQADLMSIADAIQAESEIVRMYPIAHDGTKMNEFANRLAALSARLIAIAKPGEPEAENAATESHFADDGLPSLPNAPQGAITSESGAE